MAFDGSFLCSSFKNELLTATHNFSSHTIKLALYPSSAVGTAYGSSSTIMDAGITAYQTTNELSTSGTGYSAGGNALTVASTFPKLDGTAAVLDFNDLEFTSATFSGSTAPRGAIIYNSSASNKAIAVIDFGEDKTVTSGTLTVSFPAGDSTNAIIRIR